MSQPTRNSHTCTDSGYNCDHLFRPLQHSSGQFPKCGIDNEWADKPHGCSMDSTGNPFFKASWTDPRCVNDEYTLVCKKADEDATAKPQLQCGLKEDGKWKWQVSLRK